MKAKTASGRRCDGSYANPPIMPKPKTPGKSPAKNPLTAAALVAAATAEVIRHNTKLDPTWTEPGRLGALPTEPRQCCAFHEIRIHDPKPFTRVIGRAEAVERIKTWELDPGLRKGAEPVFRRALKGLLDLADHGMRADGWKRVACEVAGSHHAGASWRRGDEGVILQALITGEMPWMLVRPEAGAATRAETSTENLAPRPQAGTRMTLVLRTPEGSQPAGLHRLGEVLAAALWRVRETAEKPQPSFKGFMLSEVAPRKIDWADEYPVMFFRRESEGGPLPRILREQIDALRGNVVLTEVLTTPRGHVKLCWGSLLRPDSDWTDLHDDQLVPADCGIPELEPGAARIEFHSKLAVVMGTAPKPPVKIGAGELLSRRVLQAIEPRPSLAQWQACQMVEDAVLRSLRWEREGRR